MIGFADHILLDLVELVDPKDAPCILAVGARFFAEAGAETDEFQRQVFIAESFVFEHAGDRDFSGAYEEGILVLDSVDLVASFGELAIADKAEFACRGRHDQGREAFAGDTVHGKIH